MLKYLWKSKGRFGLNLKIILYNVRKNISKKIQKLNFRLFSQKYEPFIKKQ